MQGKNILPTICALRTSYGTLSGLGVWAASFVLCHPVCDVTCMLSEADSFHVIPQKKEPALFQGFWKLLMAH